MHYYNFHISDFASHTHHLTDDEELAYRRLIDWQMLHEKPIPADPAEAARLIRMRDKVTDVERTLNEFFTFDAGWVNKACFAAIASFKEKTEKAVSAGKASAESRKLKQKQQVASDSGRSTDVQRPLNQPITNNHKPIVKTKAKKSEAEFEAFWKAYPKKKNKGQAAKAWAKVHVEKYPQIMATLANAVSSSDWHEQAGKFIPYPASWLNAEGWEDVYGEPSLPKDPAYNVISLAEQTAAHDALLAAERGVQSA
ncbi:MAG: YdaU family protein [Ghiorsea sp.]